MPPLDCPCLRKINVRIGCTAGLPFVVVMPLPGKKAVIGKPLSFEKGHFTFTMQFNFVNRFGYFNPSRLCGKHLERRPEHFGGREFYANPPQNICCKRINTLFGGKDWNADDFLIRNKPHQVPDTVEGKNTDT